MAFIKAEHQGRVYHMTLILATTKSCRAASDRQLSSSTALCNPNQTGGVETNRINWSYLASLQLIEIYARLTTFSAASAKFDPD